MDAADQEMIPGARVGPGQHRPLPVLVDLDGTLTLSDTLHESLLIALFRRPLSLAKALGEAPRGRLALKAALAREIDLSSHLMPLREDLLQWLTEKSDAGHEIHLCSAAHQSVAEKMSERTGLFVTAVGSTTANLKGAAKASYLRARFPDGFIYAGDGAADLPVWTASEALVLAGARPDVSSKARLLGKPVLGEFANPALGTRDVLRALRVHHWTKNLLLFAPLILSHQWSNLHLVAQTFLAFACLLAVTSATYLLNDLSDLNADRQHWSKRHRALASGRMSISAGAALVAVLLMLGFGCALLLPGYFAAVLLSYLLLTCAYSFGLKCIPLLDTLTIGLLFTLRLVMGSVLLDNTRPAWLLTFAVFFFFSLAVAKRHTEIMRAGAAGAASLRSRGYEVDDGPLTLTLGVSSALASLVVFFIFILLEMLPASAYSRPEFLFAIPLALSIWMGRIWLLAHRGQMKDDPVSFAIRDRCSLLLGAAVAASFALAL